MIGSNAQKVPKLADRVKIIGQTLADTRDTGPAPLETAPDLPQIPVSAMNLPDPVHVDPQRGIFDKVGDYLKQPGMAAALFRSGAATLKGGIGEGLTAGANYMDEQKGNAAKQAQWQGEMGLKQQGIKIDQQQADQNGHHLQNQDQKGFMDTANDTTKLGIDSYRAKLDAQLKAQGIQVDWARIAQDDTNNQRSTGASLEGTRASERNNMRSTDATNRGTDATNWRHVTPSATPPAGVGSSYSYKVPAKAPSSTGGFMGIGSTPVPGAPEVHVSGKSPPPSEQSIATLKADPSLAAQFDQQFGKGAAALYLAH